MNRGLEAKLASKIADMHIHILGICGTFMGGVAALAREAEQALDRFVET